MLRLSFLVRSIEFVKVKHTGQLQFWQESTAISDSGNPHSACTNVTQRLYEWYDFHLWSFKLLAKSVHIQNHIHTSLCTQKL